MWRDNHLKAKLRRGERAVGCWSFFRSPEVVEVLSLLGFDAIVFDHEHGAGDLGCLPDQLRALKGSSTTALVRIPENDPVYVKRVLDAGAEGIVVPSVETADEAAHAVAACRYRPQGGIRGVGYPEARASRWGTDPDYAPRAADEILVCCIIETRRGFENADAIAGVEGMDVVVPGPGDLAVDLGRFELWGDDPELTALLRRGEEAARKHGKWLCGVTRHLEGATRLAEAGYPFVAATSDLWLLSDGGRAWVEAMRRAGG